MLSNENKRFCGPNMKNTDETLPRRRRLRASRERVEAIDEVAAVEGPAARDLIELLIAVKPHPAASATLRSPRGTPSSDVAAHQQSGLCLALS
jgi:hypothetical protein